VTDSEATTPAAISRWPDVAVVLITYNHEAFVAESIAGVLNQDYQGTIHLVVGEDASSDHTRDEVVRAVAKVPSNVVPHLLLRERNVGGLTNLSDSWEVATATGSRYIALLEGDDFWVDPSKLSSQVAALEQHPSATLSFALANELIVSGDEPQRSELQVVPPTTEPAFGDLLGGNFIHTCTVVYRAGIVTAFPAWFGECAFRDWPLHLVHARAGDIHYLDRVVAVHRQHSRSRWWRAGRDESEHIEATERIQILALTHLGSPGNHRPAELAAKRALRRARASTTPVARWRYRLSALVADPLFVACKLQRRLTRSGGRLGRSAAGTNGPSAGHGRRRHMEAWIRSR
jgi:glycosyltransferase involved in cell wall biosynthesis